MKTHIRLTRAQKSPEPAWDVVLMPVAGTVFTIVRRGGSAQGNWIVATMATTTGSNGDKAYDVSETLDEIEALLDAAAKP